MKVVLCTLGIGSWYPEGVERLVSRLLQKYDYDIQPLRVFDEKCGAPPQVSSITIEDGKHDLTIVSWFEKLPPGAPENVIEDGYDYTAYCAKPFVLLAALNSGADIAIWIDAAFVPLRRLDPLIEYIAERGYYLCKNGAWVGEWSSDRCIEAMNSEDREEMMHVQEVSSYCVGIHMKYTGLVELWAHYASDRLCVPGPHANINYNLGASRVNPQRGIRGYVSADPRVKGHRHDQTVLSILAHRLGFHELTERPKFTSYQGYSTAKTVLEHRGM